MDGIVLEEIGQITEVGAIIDCHNLNVSKGERATQGHTTNASKTVNTNTTRHTLLLLCSMAATATSVFNTASGFSAMLSMPCATRNWAKAR
jgi:hypothetical protein